MNKYRLGPAAMLLISLTISGCLPASCSKTESRVLFPADSLSREIASSMTEDTLVVYGLTYGLEESPLEYPRSIQFENTGTLLVADVRQGAIIRVAADGNVVKMVAGPFEYPFLAGAAGDTSFVYDAGSNVIHALWGDTHRPAFRLKADSIPVESVRYARVHSGMAFLKVVPREGQAMMYAFNDDGNVIGQSTLQDPSWQWAGFLRSDESTLYSLRGYQPVIDVFDDEMERDSIKLVGFDSPMLARTRSFMLGDAKAPPLLSSATAIARDKLFVLNMRPGWTRIDIYSLEGILEHVLIRANPQYNKEYYPTDIAVRMVGDNRYLIAVSYVEPDGRVETYEWVD